MPVMATPIWACCQPQKQKPWHTHTHILILFALYACPVIRDTCMQMSAKANVHTHPRAQNSSHPPLAPATISCDQQSGFLGVLKCTTSFCRLLHHRTFSLALSLSLFYPLPFYLTSFWLLSLSSPAVSFCHSLFPLMLFSSFLFLLACTDTDAHTLTLSLLFLSSVLLLSARNDRRTEESPSLACGSLPLTN